LDEDITIQEVNKLILSMKSNKVTGSDGIPAEATLTYIAFWRFSITMTSYHCWWPQWSLSAATVSRNSW